MASQKKKAIVLVAHDAGGAEVLSSWARRQKRPLIFVLAGPAVAVFQRKFDQLSLTNLEGLPRVDEIEEMVTATSWSSDLERRALQWAIGRKIPTTTFLDHWINYRVRFETEHGLVLPDKILVYDQIGLERAKKEFPQTQIEIVENPYWEDFKSEVRILEHAFVEEHSQMGTSKRISVLFTTQPIMDVARKITGSERGYGYTEFEALDAFLEWLSPRMDQIREFRLRLHPSETVGKYNSYQQKLAGKVRLSFSDQQDLARDIAWAEWVVGADTMAMVLGLLCDRKVYSCIPKGGRKLEIPLDGITRLFE